MLQIIIGILASFAIYLAIALVLIFSKNPAAKISGQTLKFDRIRTQQRPQLKLQSFNARDGADLQFREILSKHNTAPLVVVVHGSGWHGKGYSSLARNISSQFDAHILIPDLRGHGPKPVTRGDVAYIGQLEDDLADLIQLKRTPDQPVYLVGHSSGGGLVVRFCAGEHGELAQKAVLMSPFLKYNAPTMRANSGGWAYPLSRRIIGLSMLNLIGITTFNHLPAIQFNFPQAVLDRDKQNAATPQYSFRLNQSYAPKFDYLKDIAELPEFLLIAGEDDEAFNAKAFEPLMSEQTPNGIYELMPKESHLSIIDSQRAAQKIAEFLE